MRRLLVLFTLLAVGAIAAAGVHAQVAVRGDGAGRLEIDDGVGVAVVDFRRGAVYGHVGKGRLVVTLRRPLGVDVVVSGAETAVERGDRTTVYQGSDIRFSVSGPGFRIGVQGSGIAAGIVGRGIVTLRGTGTMSVDGAAEQPWPADFRTVVLGG
jgi:hypothetical protein